MIVFKRYGKTVKISNRHWKSLRRRFNPDNAVKSRLDSGGFRIWRYCLLCREHHGCERCGLGVFGKEGGEEPTRGCAIFLRRLFKNKVAFDAGDVDVVRWHKGNDAEVRRQLKRIQKLMDEIEAQQ